MRMFNRFLIALIPAAVFTVATTAAIADTGQDLAARTLPHVVTIRLFDAMAQETGFGSGFWIGGGEVVTNAHVVTGCAWAEIHAVDGQLIGTVPHAVLLDVANDLAVLSVPGGREQGLTLAGADPAVGASVWAFGAPLGLEGTVSTGIISATRDREGHHWLQMTAPISAGSSGGPVVDETGAVVGIAAAVMAVGQNLNFAIPVGTLSALLQQPRAPQAFPESGPAAEDSGDAYDISVMMAFLNGLAQADTMTCGSRREGRLEKTDADLQGPTDFLTFHGKSGERVEIGVSSHSFDPSVMLLAMHMSSQTGEPWFIGADGYGGRDARCAIVLPSTGQYHVIVHAIDGRKGDYEVSLACSPTVEPIGDDSWVRVEGGDDKTVLWNERAVTRSGPEVTVWVRFIYYQACTDDDGTTYNIMSRKCLFDCANRQMKIIANRRFRSGEVVSSVYDDPYKIPWQAVAPATWAEAVFEAACGDR